MAAAEVFVSTDQGLLNIDFVHEFLRSSYWAQNIPRQVLEKSIQNSICFGLYKGPQQIGFARVVTDQATFAYLCDVFIADAEQGRGLGKYLIGEILNHPAFQVLRRFNLATRDAHGLYQQFGFKNLKSPERYMEIVKPDAYRGLT